MTNWWDIWGAPRMKSSAGFTYNGTRPFSFTTEGGEPRWIIFPRPFREMEIANLTAERKFADGFGINEAYKHFGIEATLLMTGITND